MEVVLSIYLQGAWSIPQHGSRGRPATPRAVTLGWVKGRGQLGLLVAMGLGSLSLRPQLVGVGPLLPNIQHSLGISHAVAGLLVTIPVLCMGLFAPSAAVLASRVGTNRAVGAALVLVAVAGIARAVSPGAALVLLVTVPVGIGMALGNALMPLAVKGGSVGPPAARDRRLHDRDPGGLLRGCDHRRSDRRHLVRVARRAWRLRDRRRRRCDHLARTRAPRTGERRRRERDPAPSGPQPHRVAARCDVPVRRRQLLRAQRVAAERVSGARVERGARRAADRRSSTSRPCPRACS